MVQVDSPASVEQARATLAQEWEAVAPSSTDEVLDFYRTSAKLGDDLDAWHRTDGRKSWTDMIVHIAKQMPADVVMDIGAGAGHDLRALQASADRAHCPTLHAVEPNDELRQAIAMSGTASVWADVQAAPVEEADLLICVDVLEHVVAPETFLGGIARRAKIGAILFETTATDDCGTPLHLAENRGWHPGRVLEQAGWRVVDKADRVRVWKRVAAEGQQTSSVLLCAYKQDRYYEPTMALTGQAVESGPWRFRAKYGDALISRSRSIIVTGWWRETGDDTFLMIDADITYKPEDADRAVELCRQGYDIVCGAYPVHNGEYLSLKCLPGTKNLQFGPGNPPVEIEYAATGFLAVHRRVIDAMVATLPLCHSKQPWSFYPFFDTSVVVDEEAGGYAWLSEDYGFSQLARDLGFKVWLDPQTYLQHGSNISVSVHNMGGILNAVKQA